MEAIRRATERLIRAFDRQIIDVNDFKKLLWNLGWTAGSNIDYVVGEGQIVTFTAEGGIRPVRSPDDVPIGIAINGDLVRLHHASGDGFTRDDFERARELVRRGGYDPQIVIGRVDDDARGSELVYEPEERYDVSYAMMASVAWPANMSAAFGQYARYPYNGDHRYRYSKFSKDVDDKAWKLLEKFMDHDQYSAFMNGTRVELINRAGDHRLLLHRNGEFSILKGAKGAGIEMTSGKIHSSKYPLGDEIAAFLDWFNHKTEELIDNWRCGNFDIKR